MCVLWAVEGQSHLFENHELIQEVNTLAGEKFPDGLLFFTALKVRGHAHRAGLVLQELGQREVLRRLTVGLSGNTQTGKLCFSHCAFTWREIKKTTTTVYSITVNLQPPLKLRCTSLFAHLCTHDRPAFFWPTSPGSCTTSVIQTLQEFPFCLLTCYF